MTKKNHVISWNKKIIKPLWTKKHRVTSGQKNHTSEDKITKPFGTKKITKPLGTKEIMQHLWTKKNCATS